MEGSWQLQTYSTQSATTAPAEGVEWRLQWRGNTVASSGNPPREGTRGCSAAENPPSTWAGRQRGAKSLAAEPAAGAQLLSSHELGSSEGEGKGKGIICAVLGA